MNENPSTCVFGHGAMEVGLELSQDIAEVKGTCNLPGLRIREVEAPYAWTTFIDTSLDD
jgi:hypothetical protein